MLMRTSAAMLEAAEDAHDVAAGDEAVAWVKLVAALDDREAVSVARARWVVAFAAADYALAVLRSVQADHLVSVRATA